MSHEIAPKNVYVSPHLKAVMREKHIYISDYQPDNLDKITQALNVPNIEDKSILLRSGDAQDTFHKHVDANVIVSVSPNALNPLKPQYLTRTTGRAILMDPKLNPNYRVPNSIAQTSFWRQMGVGGAGVGITAGSFVAKAVDVELPFFSHEVYAGFGAALLAGTAVRYSIKYLVTPMILETYDAFRVHRMGSKVESPFTLAKIDQGSGGFSEA